MEQYTPQKLTKPTVCTRRNGAHQIMHKHNQRGWLRPSTAAASILAATLVVSACGSSEVAGPSGVVGDFIELTTSGEHVAALDLATPETAASQRDFSEALEVWNLRSELTEPCEATESAVWCVFSDVTDFHKAGGVSPYTVTVGFVVNDAGLISGMDFSISEWESVIQPFNFDFWIWIRNAHPEAELEFAPMGSTFNAERARIALEYVDEFVAQSDVYPIEP